MSILLVIALAGTAGAAKTNVTRARAAVREADVRRCAAVAARDLDRFLALLADDVAFFPDQRAIVQGKPAARTLFAPFFDAKGPALRCEPSTAEVAASGELAYTTGTYLVTGAEAGLSATRGHGKYVTVWRKRGGRWLLAVDIGNGTPPVEPDFGPPPPP
jgi:ketosteroid isomerase-like protein